MKTLLPRKTYVFYIFIVLLLSIPLQAQVGIGTITPNADALLDIDATMINGGLLIPRIALTTDSTDPSPLTAHVAGMMIYNTATVGDLTPGYYFNEGGSWARVNTGAVTGSGWSLTGNLGTNTGANALGTNDDAGLRIRTNNFNRFEVTSGTTAGNGGRLRAFTNGTAASPIYSWNANQGTGMFQQAANVLGLSTNGTERMRILANGNIGINTPTPTEALHVTGNMRVNGALMPNNVAGTTGQLLRSAGAGVSPTWGPNLGNVTDITRYIVTGPDLDPNTVYSLAVTIAGVTTQSTGIVTITGNWAADIFDDVTIHNIEMRTNEVRFAISNNTNGGTAVIYPAMQYNITVIR